MMQTLRKYMKHVMWIVAVTFIATIVFSWGMGGFKKRGVQAESGVVGVINGRKVMYQQFAATLEQEYKKVRETEKTDELSEYRRSSIRDQVWNNMVREMVMADEVTKHELIATPEEIVYFLRNNPPQDIQTNPQFQTNGQFDMSKYQKALTDPQNTNAVIGLENYYRMTIPIQKLQQNVLATVRVSDGEVEQAYWDDNLKVDVKYTFFDPARIPVSGIHVVEKEMRNYYEQHKKEYLDPEQRKIQYVLFETKPTRADSNQTHSEARDLMDTIKGGADFSQLAKEYSEDKGSAEKGGDLGFFAKGAMVKPFEDAAFSAKVGQVVGPVETPFGLHIIKVIAKKQEKGQTQVQASHILLTFKTSPETQDAAQERAQYMSDEIAKTKGKNFEEVAKELKMEVKETDWFRKGGFIPGLGMASRVNYLTFQDKAGWVSPIINLDKNTILFRISAIQEAKHRSFEDVKSSIQSILVQQKQKDESGKRCTEFRKKISDTREFEKLALQDSLEVKETGYFSMKSYVPQIGRDPKFVGAAFSLKKNELSQPIEGVRGYYLVLWVDRTAFDQTAFDKEKTTYKNNLVQMKQNQFYAAWMKQLMDKAKIKDYREVYF